MTLRNCQIYIIILTMINLHYITFMPIASQLLKTKLFLVLFLILWQYIILYTKKRGQQYYRNLLYSH